MDNLILVGGIVFAAILVGVIVLIGEMLFGVFLFVALFAFLGSLIDNAVGTNHVFAAIGACMGAVILFILLCQDVIRKK